MSQSKKPMMGFMSPMPMWGWSVNMDERKEQWEDFKSTMENFWGQMQDMQKTSMDNWKEQWNKTFPQFLEMEDNFIDSLPDELPTLPGMPSSPMTPKEFMDKLKEFQEMTNKHAVEQADSVFDFFMQSQQQAKAAVSDAVKNFEEKVEKTASNAPDYTVTDAE